MVTRYAKLSDLDFLIKGLEENRVYEGRKKKASKEDIQDFKTSIRKRNVRILELNKEPVGFIHFKSDFRVLYCDEKFLWVDLVFVKKDQRGRGLGKRLYADAKAIGKKRGCKEIVIDIFDKNIKSQNFHVNAGFKPYYTIYKKSI